MWLEKSVGSELAQLSNRFQWCSLHQVFYPKNGLDLESPTNLKEVGIVADTNMLVYISYQVKPSPCHGTCCVGTWIHLHGSYCKTGALTHKLLGAGISLV